MNNRNFKRKKENNCKIYFGEKFPNTFFKK